METIIDRVVSAAGRHEGAGNGNESGPFTAVLEITSILDGMGAAIDYVATASDGTRLHAEHTTLAFDMWSGEATLYVLCDELRGTGQLVQIADSTFNNGRGIEGFELQVEITIGNNLDYVWSWGPPGEELVEQSRATFPLR